jgi:integrase
MRKAPTTLPGKRTLDRVDLTKRIVAGFECPAGQGEASLYDAVVRGLAVRALASGKKTFIYSYRGKDGRAGKVAIGDAGSLSIETARQLARQHSDAVAKGVHPGETRHSKTMGAVIAEYLSYIEGRQRPNSFRMAKRHLEVHAKPLHGMALDAVHRLDIARLLETVARTVGETTSNRVRAHISAFFGWAIKNAKVELDSNPTTLTWRHEEEARKRTLSDAELRALWEATDDWQSSEFSRVIRLLLVTAARRDEIALLKWGEIGRERITVSGDRVKGKEQHEIEMSPTIAMLVGPRPKTATADTFVFGRTGTGFKGFGKSKARLDQRMAKLLGIEAVKPWVLHDMRHTVRTRLDEDGRVLPHVSEALLGHKQKGIKAVYSHALFRKQKAQALQVWLELLAKAIG